jgi:DNA polymerase III delta prime subunit
VPNTIQSLNEIEEERSRSRRGRSRRRGKEQSSKKHTVTSCSTAATSPTVTYDPSTPSSVQWTKKYAPQMAGDVVGNGAVVRQLQSWLEEWMAKRKRAKRAKKKSSINAVRRSHSNRSNNSSNSFVVDDEFEDESSSDSYSDDSSADDNDGDDFPPTTALLRGPTGVGKTSTVYALARQLGFKVLEVNASSLRGGRQVTAQLQEATQSHNVKSDKREALKELLSSSSVAAASDSSSSRSKTALILFEDIDVVFEDQDEGFYAAVNALAATTKRPVILTTSNPHFSPGKFLKSDPRPFVFSSAPAAVIARHLQLLCLCEGFSLDADRVAQLIEFNGGGGGGGGGGDAVGVARSILDLQYWTTSSSLRLRSPDTETENDKERKKTKVLDERHEKEEEEKVPGGGEKKEEGRALEEQQQKSVARSSKRERDLIAKLMSINKKEECEEGQRNPLLRFSAGCLGGALSNTFSDDADAGIDAGKLFEDICRVQRLWMNGFGEFYEMNKDIILPFPLRLKDNAAATTTKRPFPIQTDAAEGEVGSVGVGYKRIKRPFGAGDESDSSENEEQGKDVKQASQDSGTNNVLPPKTDSEKVQFLRRQSAMQQMSDCAEISSHFLMVSNVGPWWAVEGSKTTGVENNALADEIGATAQFLAVSRAREFISCLLDEDDGDDDGMKLVCDGDGAAVSWSLMNEERKKRNDIDREVLNKCLPDLTVSPQPLLLDQMAVLRGMARSEEVRRAGKGAKRSRSGRFLHYFETQEMFFKPATLVEMCNAFL